MMKRILMIIFAVCMIACSSAETVQNNPETETPDVTASAEPALETETIIETETERISLYIPDEFDIRKDENFIRIYCRRDPETEMIVYFQKGFGVCGTGLKQEKTTINGRAATIGTYDDHTHWDFAVFKVGEKDFALTRSGLWEGDELNEFADMMLSSVVIESFGV